MTSHNIKHLVVGQLSADRIHFFSNTSPDLPWAPWSSCLRAPSGLLIGASGACNRGRRHVLTLRVLYLYSVNRPPAISTENPTTSVVQYKHSTATTSSQQTTTTASQQTTTNSTSCSHQLTTTACIGIVSYNQRLTENCSS